jgi:hypothetical protein
LQSTEDESSSLIKELDGEMEKMSRNHQEERSELEEKLMLSERGNRQKEQLIEELNEEL